MVTFVLADKTYRRRVVTTIRRLARVGGVRILAATVVVLAVAAVLFMLPVSAATVNISPNATVSHGWTGNSSCNTTPHTCINNGTSPNTTTYIGTGTSLQGVSSQFDIANPATMGVATELTFYIYARSVSALGTLADAVDMNLSVDGVALATESKTMTTSWQWHAVTYTGSWTAAQVDSLQASVTRVVKGTGSATANDDDVRIASMYVSVTHFPPSVADQAAYRLYDNNSTVEGGYTAPSIRSSTSMDYSAAPKPAGVTAGDLLVFIYAADAGVVEDMVLPSGFTEIASQTMGSNNGHLKIGTKVAGSSEPSSYSYGANASATTHVDLLAVENAGTDTTPVVTTSVTPTSSTSHVAPSVTPEGTNDLLLSLALIRFGSSTPTTSWTPPAGMTEMTDSNVDSWMAVTVARQALTTGGATGTRTFGLSTPVARPAITASITIRGAGSVTGPELGAPRAPQNTAASIIQSQTPFRLRMNVGMSTTDTAANAKTYKLQFAPRGADDACDAAFVSETYQDVTSQSAIAYYDNITAPNGVAMSDSANSPVRSGVTAINQSYVEANPFTNIMPIAAGQDGIWDFSLVSLATTELGNYCLRAVGNDGNLLDTYTVIPEVILAGSVGQVSYRWYENSNSGNVSSPAILMEDSFSAANGSAWDGAKWALGSNSSTGGSVTVENGQGRMIGGTGASYNIATGQSRKVNIPDRSDVDITTTFELTNDDSHAYVWVRGNASILNWSQGYYFSFTRWGSYIDCANAADCTGFSQWIDIPGVVVGQKYKMRVQAIGDTIRMKHWPAASAEPGSWAFSKVSTVYPSGTVGIAVPGATANETMLIDDVLVTTGVAATSTGPDVGAPLAAANTAAVAPEPEVPFRLRIAVGTQGHAPVVGKNYYLQYAGIGGDGVCDAGFSGESYANITTSSVLKFYDNSSSGDGDQMLGNANDPVRVGVDSVAQSYEETNPLSLLATVPAGYDSLWDVALAFDASTIPANRYCIRIVDANYAPLASYAVVAEVIVPGLAPPTLQQQLRGGQSVVQGVKRPFSW